VPQFNLRSRTMPTSSSPGSATRGFVLLTAVLGVISFGVVLAYHNIADGDLWAKLALGAAVWNDGHLPAHDLFAFTPTLPVYVDHEWGSGLVFFTLLKWFGGSSLLLLKMLLALLTTGIGLIVARRFESDWPTLLAFAIPCGFCVLPGFVPVVRSHAFTFACFSAMLLLLEWLRAGQRWPAFALVGLMMLWVNLHGGFVAGLGAIAIYCGASVIERKGGKFMFPALLGCIAATMVNPYGPKYWAYVWPAILHKRGDIVEWQPMPLWGHDAFLGFRILLILVILCVIFGWRGAKKSLPGLCMLLITAVLALRSRRHAPFFGAAALAFAAPFASSAVHALFVRFQKQTIAIVAWPRIVCAIFVALALYVSVKFLPGASLHVIAPISQFPVREADILSEAGASGNLAVPFEWGSYASWRLYPRIRVSMDGRYEAAYPESSYEMNRDFFAKRGPEWDRLLKRHTVDFVALNLQLGKLAPEDLEAKGYKTVWFQEGVSALLALNQHAAQLRSVATNLPPTTIDPLDPSIPARWPPVH
jgi:hypothetical protein